MPGFVHLHTHSDYSLLDGAQKISKIVKRAAELNMRAIALTDHGVLYGAIEFYETCKKHKIKPIIGCEVYVATGSRFDKKTTRSEGTGNNHLVLLAMNNTGYKNLIKLVSLGFTEGFYYRPRVDMALLKKYNDGLIATSACLKGRVAEQAVKHSYEAAKETALEYASLFPDRFYLEIQRHGLEEEVIANEALVRIHKETEIPLICANDAHYNTKEEAESHDVLMCIGTGKQFHDQNRLKYKGDSFYLKSPEQMAELFEDIPEALENTVKIAEQCNVIMNFGEYHMPNFPIPDDVPGKDPALYLKQLSEKGLEKKFPDGKVPETYKKRLDYELNVINSMKFPGYFLITQDFMRYAREHDIPVGPGRGSAAGSLVAYSLGITNIDPLKYDLLFERFLNPRRVNMPDIDTDFCYERRGEIIEYIRELYGENSVSQIITFGTLKAKGLVRDIARVMGMTYAEGDRIAKLIPEDPGMTLEKAEKLSEDIRNLLRNDERYRILWRHAKVLQGMNRHFGVHAAGVVIAPGNLTDYIPVAVNNNGELITQYDMKSVEKVGVIKMDFLGLRTLTVIYHAIKMIKEKGIDLDIDSIPLDDESTFRLFCEGHTHGIFQFESGGMREYLRKLKPSHINDLIAMNALYRPGPIENIPAFISRKNGIEKVSYLHPLLEPILKSTYGIIVYQEQVMQIASEIGGFDLGDADLLRRAMGKKKMKIMEEKRIQFIRGAKERKVPEKKANDIYDLLIKFAEYGFNKSHSVAYAYVAYQTAYLKAHYPAEFMAASLTSERTNIKRVVELINELQKLGIPMIPPDVNVSETLFTTKDNAIVYGLNAIKNVGEKVSDAIAEARKSGDPFKSIFDLTCRVDPKMMNRKVLESLIFAGAMDSFEGNRAQKMNAVDLALTYGQRYQDEANNAQVSLFGESVKQVVLTEPPLENIPEWNVSFQLEREKEHIGFYLSGHPLEDYRDEIEAVSNIDLIKDDTRQPPDIIKAGGIIKKKNIRYNKQNNPWAILLLETLTDDIKVIAFHKGYMAFKDLIEENKKVFVTGRLSERDRDRDEISIILESIEPIENIRDVQLKQIHLRMKSDDAENVKVLNGIKSLFNQYPGKLQIYIHILCTDTTEKIIQVRNIRANASRELLVQLRKKLGNSNVWLKA
jgi:DNA polymerase III subunit alpha